MGKIVVILINFLLTFWWEDWIFLSAWKDAHLLQYLAVKISTLLVLAGFWYLIFRAWQDKKSTSRKIVLYALPCAALLIGKFLLQTKGHYLPGGDEAFIFHTAQTYDLFPYHFLYPTGLFAAIGMQLFPFYCGPVVLHILFQSFVCGYCVEKLNTKWVYGLFLLSPVLEYGLHFHRMQTYGLLYLLLFVKCYTDYRLEKSITKKDFIFLTVLCVILSFWRREGFYLLLTGGAIIITTYRMRIVKRYVCMYVCIAALVLLPEIGHDMGQDSVAGETDIAYVAAFCQMERLGLDEEKYPVQIRRIGQVLDLQMVNDINKVLGTRTNNDIYFCWTVDEFVGAFPKDDLPQALHDGRKLVAVKSSFSDEFRNDVNYLLVNEPLLYLQSRCSIFHTAARNDDHSEGMKYLKNVIIWNLYLPLGFIILSLWRNIREMRWKNPLLLLEMGLLLHTMITMLVSPCGYFKYYYHVYLIGWVIFFLWLAEYIKKRRIRYES